MTKIHFLLLIISVFVALSYIPIRSETKHKQKAESNAASTDSLPA